MAVLFNRRGNLITSIFEVTRVLLVRRYDTIKTVPFEIKGQDCFVLRSLSSRTIPCLRKYP